MAVFQHLGPLARIYGAMVTMEQDLSSLVGAALRKLQQRDFAGAEEIYKQVLAQDSKHADALHLYGCLCDELGRTDEAVALISGAVKCNPLASPYFYNLANMLSKQGRYAEAILQYRTAIKLKPDYAVAHNNLGMVLSRQGDHVGAKTCFQNAIRSRADYADPHYNLGIEYKNEGALSQAVSSYQHAIRINPRYADAHYNLGNAYGLMQRPTEAVVAYAQASGISPDNAVILTNWGTQLLKLGRVQEAVRAFAGALRLDPCDVLTHSNLILAKCYATSDPAEIYAQCKEWDLFHGVHHRPGIQPPIDRLGPKRSLRVGYVSADFRQHAAAHWIEPLLAGHQHQSFSIYCYSNSKITDAVTDRLKRHADVWIDATELDDDALAKQIQRDQIDILVDLSGHTEGNRLPVFARKPAPVQVSWFGFPVSTGLQAMDYRLTDSIVDPIEDSEKYYSEKLFRLPHFYAAFDPGAQTPPIEEGPVTRNGYITFASFNNFTKVSQAMVLVWCQILRAMPKSQLLLQAAGLETEEMRAEIRALVSKNGVEPERLLLRGWSGLNEYLALGSQVDIALDTYPFNGGVTTCHALWMGLPVVTLSGNSAASRVGRSILTNIGLAELCAESADQYQEIALALAQDSRKLATMRASLRDRMRNGGLLDGASLAQEAEQAYRTMWDNETTA